MASTYLPCRHCGEISRRRASKPRALCYRCYAEMSIRCLYPINTRSEIGKAAAEKAKRERERTESASGDGSQPTDAWCGTSEKLSVLRDRAARGLPLFNPEDGPEITLD